MLMIYGAAGYTARLIVHALARAGVPSVIAGRDLAALKRAALPGEPRGFVLDDAAGLAAGLAGITVVLNATGRYRETALPLVRACLARGIHYLDLAGEVAEHTALLALDGEARAAGAMVMPGVGFGVVPTELAAVEAARRLGAPPARLMIAYDTVGGASRGTLETVLREIHHAGVQRRGGALVEVRPGARRTRVRFGDGPPVRVVTNPWRADLVSAFVALGSPDIETFASFPAMARLLMSHPWLTGSWLGRWLIDRVIAGAPAGPSADERAAGRTQIRVEAFAGEHRVVIALRGPEAYDLTAQTAAAIAARVVAGAGVPGFATPSRVLSWADLLALPGVTEVAA